MTKKENLEAQISKMMNKAFRSLTAANHHRDDDDYDFASSRAYYAVFYAVEALLLTKNLSFSKHGNVIGAFNKHFIKTSIFPKEYNKWIARLFRERQTGDYEFEFVISEEDAIEDINLAKTIVENLNKYIKKNTDSTI